MRALALLVLPALLLVLTPACGTDGTDEVDLKLTVSATIDPDPPTTGQNTLTIHVEDAAGVAVTGASVTVDPQMPMMGHGSPESAQITELGSGDYEAFPVTFSMPGHWEVTITATHTEGEDLFTGSVMIPYDLP